MNLLRASQPGAQRLQGLAGSAPGWLADSLLQPGQRQCEPAAAGRIARIQRARAGSAARTRIAQGRTVMIIAHRLSAVRPCHRIITVEAGEVTEMGSHDELLRAGGRYAQLHAKQTGMAAG